MSFGGYRHSALSSRQHDLTSIQRARSTALRGLKAVHATIQNNSPLSTLFNFSADADKCSDDDTEFLQKFDLASGRAFDPTTLTLRLSPTTNTSPRQHDAPISDAKPTSDLTDSVARVESSLVAGAHDPQHLEPVRPTDTTSLPSVADQSATTKSSRTSPQPDGASIAPATVAPPLPEDEAQLDGPTQELLDMQSPPKPAKVVHLPPQKVQEEALREREAEESQRRSDSESARSQRLKIPNADLASSPSSTVGAYSAATPGPPLDSPDTSPDSDGGQIEVAPPKDLQPTPEQQREKDEHDRLLAAQKEIARQQALGDVATPDEQLRWEEREAAARSAEEQAARDGLNGPEPDASMSGAATEADHFVEDLETADAAQASDSKAVEKVEEELATAPTQVEDDEESIAVKPRSQAGLRVDTTSQRASPLRTEGGTAPRMITRVSSGALRQKSVSEILGQTPSQSPELSFAPRRESDLISPLTQRHPGDAANRSVPSVMASSSPHTPRQARTLSQYRLSANVDPAINELQVLKGAAEDPERDYLESLFRIQAHESPNSRTRTLPDLVGKGVKVLSTEDHYTALHERLDFRMLRRIYQLQNANKWSLRQMEKCKEPEEPVSHHDHMMAEMKWMRKDFRAERRTKKNTCAWLAERCCEWVNADAAGRQRLQVKVNAPQPVEKPATPEGVPELEHAGDSAPEDDAPTPRAGSPLPTRIIVAPELANALGELEASGKVSQVLKALPKLGLPDRGIKHEPVPFTAVSRFIEGKILPKVTGPSRKRSRYDYDDEEEVLSAQPSLKRLRQEEAPEAAECALFQAENKPIRDRLHSNNAFRPPSEFIMPSTPFYEYRNGSQWIWEDDQKLRKLAKEYTFNWSLIADELSLQTRYKSSAERRTPWECFERWVELESLPADMRKTVYFKTWFNRLESSQQAAERRYQAQVTAIQQAAQASGGPTHIPLRRRTTPTRVEKRRSTRYLWMVDGFRKLAKKREQAAWKQAETARAAAQRKSQSETTNQAPQVKLTPQQFSKKRHERDVAMLEAARQHRAKLLEAQQQQRNLQMARAAQQQGGQAGMPPVAPGQQRPPGVGMPQQHAQMQANGQQVQNPNGQVQGQQGRPMQPIRNGHLAVPNTNGQGIPQAQMQARVAPHPNMQQMQHANGQARNPQFAAQQFQLASGNMGSPGPGGMTNQQQLQNNQALLAAAFTVQQQQHGVAQGQAMNGVGQQKVASPSMPPPPTPQGGPQQLSSGHVPAINAIKTQLRAANPNMSQEQLDLQAMQQLKTQHQSMTQARQNAMNAAAGIPSQPSPSMQQPQQQAYNNQSNYQGNRPMSNGGMPGGMYVNGEGNVPQPNMTPANNTSPPQQQQAYAQKMMRMQQMQMQMQQSPNQGHPNLNGGSPAVAHASPNMTPASPSMQFSNMNQMGAMNQAATGMNGQRPTSRSNTPQMQRLGSSGSGVSGMNGNGMQSPGGTLQGSPRNMQASMAR